MSSASVTLACSPCLRHNSLPLLLLAPDHPLLDCGSLQVQTSLPRNFFLWTLPESTLFWSSGFASNGSFLEIYCDQSALLRAKRRSRRLLTEIPLALAAL